MNTDNGLPTVCPKCGQHRNIVWNGPFYTKIARIGEFLKYTCVNCGYTISTPCKDAK